MLAEIFLLRLEAQRRVLEMAGGAREPWLHRSRGPRVKPDRRRWSLHLRPNLWRGFDSGGFLFNQLRRRGGLTTRVTDWS
jgi:hypothetical protein